MAAHRATPEQRAETLRLLAEAGTEAGAAKLAGVSRSTMQARIRIARQRPNDERKVPLSEDQRKFQANWTAADCIAELLRIVKIDTTKVISRNYFRVHSDISESTWNRWFGTFEEFKRQAGVKLSRHAHRMERDIAKHASVDNMRLVTAEKQKWEGNYLRPCPSRWQTVVVVNDVHDTHCCPFYRRVLIDTVQRVQPEKIVFNGDIFDLPEYSKHTQDPRHFNLVGRIKWVHKFFKELREAAPNSEMTLVEGNHEHRLLRHLAEETPAMMVILADLHNFTVSKLLGLDQFGINFIARSDLSGFNERDLKEQLKKNYVTLWNNSLLFGHFPEMRAMGIPGANGHHHRHLVWSAYSPDRGPYEWHQVGCGHARAASYCAGERWQNGFLIVHTDTRSRRSQFEYVDLSHSGAMVGGKFYERSPEEATRDLLSC